VAGRRVAGRNRKSRPEYRPLRRMWRCRFR
jgi:hypothetical protein